MAVRKTSKKATRKVAKRGRYGHLNKGLQRALKTRMSWSAEERAEMSRQNAVKGYNKKRENGEDHQDQTVTVSSQERNALVRLARKFANGADAPHDVSAVDMFMTLDVGESFVWFMTAREFGQQAKAARKRGLLGERDYISKEGMVVINKELAPMEALVITRTE